MHFLLFLLLVVPFVRSEDTPLTESERDFLFLAAEEPEQGSEQKQLVPVHAEESHVTSPAPSMHKKMTQHTQTYVDHAEKIEDMLTKLIESPSFTIRKKLGDFTLSGRFRPETFYSKNTTLLNDCAPLDRAFYVRHTIDINGNVTCRQCAEGDDAAQIKFTLRNKGTWGNPASIAPTNDASFKDIDATIGSHRHSLGRHVVWIRELWLKMCLNDLFRVTDAPTKHYFLLGFYPFSVGHGIALGTAYAVNSGLLGFYTDNVVDQFAPGFLFTGDLIKDRLSYDVYGAIFENKSDSMRNNSEQIYLQRFGRRDCPARGFGHVNWLIAGRFQAVAFDHATLGKFELEPYGLFNHAPEQKVEFPADAKSELGTLGIELDYTNKNFDMCFEIARNFGAQTVWGWDRNQIVRQLDSTTAVVRHVNSHVFNEGTTTKALDISANQTIINNSFQAASANGQVIGGGLQNALNRFSDQYASNFKGWMCIADAGYWFFDRQLQVAIAFGLASGDENPNTDFDLGKGKPSDNSFDGFVGLQEVYTGDRVESALVLGARSIVRPLSLPNDAIQRGLFASTVSEFTNIGYAGAGLHIVPKTSIKPYIRPNLMFFWQEEPSSAFDKSLNQPSAACAPNFLGSELNLFVDLFPLECLKAYGVIALFIPGSHYDAVQGTPINKQQLDFFQQADVDVTTLPLLGVNNAFTLNLGFEYRF